MSRRCCSPVINSRVRELLRARCKLSQAGRSVKAMWWIRSDGFTTWACSTACKLHRKIRMARDPQKAMVVDAQEGKRYTMGYGSGLKCRASPRLAQLPAQYLRPECDRNCRQSARHLRDFTIEHVRTHTDTFVSRRAPARWNTARCLRTRRIIFSNKNLSSSSPDSRTNRRT